MVKQWIRSSGAALLFGVAAVTLLIGAASGASTQQAAVPQKGRPHPAVEAKTGETCLECHPDIKAKKMLHGPVAAAECSPCHTLVATGKDEAIIKFPDGASADNMAAVCTTCHDGVGERLKASSPHAPAAGGECTTCHDPHGSDSEFVLKTAGTALCITCHDTAGEALAKKFPHAPAEKSCTVCHDPHGDRNPKMMRDGLNELCLQCHQQQPQSPSRAAAEAPASIPPPEEVTKTTMELGKDAKKLVLRDSASRGHPTSKHPVKGPNSLVDKSQPLTCATCHEPHGAVSKALLRFGATTGTALCMKCHEV